MPELKAFQSRSSLTRQSIDLILKIISIHSQRSRAKNKFTVLFKYLTEVLGRQMTLNSVIIIESVDFYLNDFKSVRRNEMQILRARVVPVIRWRSSQLKWPASEKVPHSLLTLDFD